MVALGLLNAYTGCVKNSSLTESLKDNLGGEKKDLLNVDIKAMEAGAGLIRI